jgi:hypothetical protein
VENATLTQSTSHVLEAPEVALFQSVQSESVEHLLCARDGVTAGVQCRNTVQTAPFVALQELMVYMVVLRVCSVDQQCQPHLEMS